MISHLSVEAALKLTAGDRAAARAVIRRNIIAQVEAEALLAGCSEKCRQRRHANEVYGCANDGSTCICVCHDAGRGGGGA